MSKFVFADSWALWALIPLFFLWLFFWLRRQGFLKSNKPRATAALRYSSISALQTLRPSKSIQARSIIVLFRVAAVLLLVFAVARPQAGRKRVNIKTEGIDIILAIDTSGSMMALDLDADKKIIERRNRLEVAQSVVKDFLEKRENDQIGLVVFGSEAFTQCPLTLDHGIVASFLGSLEIGMAGDGTAIGSALGGAVKRLQKSNAKSKIIILLTDGRSNSGNLSPQKAAEIAKAFDIKVYTIGVGTRGNAPFIVNSIFGKQIQHQQVDIDEKTLSTIATLTGGTYFRAEDTEALESIYSQIDQLEKTEIKSNAYLEYDEKFPFFVAPALGFLLLEILLLGTRFRKIP